jgi:hypothetical protein
VTADCVTLWVGDALGPLERACLKSMLRQGHSVALYCYRTPSGVPDGVQTLDASNILPETSIRPEWARRSDLYSDWFRYEIQKRGLGTWLDLDVYLVAPLDLERPYLFGEYEPGKINGAVLRLPPDSPMLTPLLEQFDGTTVPRGMLPHRQFAGHLRKLVHGTYDLANTRWGTTGPFALTKYVRDFGLSSEALPPEVFYPAPWQKAAWVADPAIQLEDFVTEKTMAVHLWNELLRDIKHEPAPEGSFLARLQREGRE